MKNNVKKIIIFSGKQFSGKDTAAKFFLEKMPDFKRMGIADSIKNEYSTITGLSIDEIEKNKSRYRKDLIELGNKGRAISPDYWLNTLLEFRGNIAVTDVRMKHELDVFKKHGAFTVRVNASEQQREKRGILTAVNDETETQLDSVNDWDYIINNEGSLKELEIQIENLIKNFNKYML
ncbi:MAG: hypothetical protein LUG16_08855 [Candidatus Gastranaerophilales bacterium]|nr:hypothetical protein [Candidatus Gastranaerophilales bacterium]